MYKTERTSEFERGKGDQNRYPHGAPVLLGRARDKGRGAWPILPTAVLFPAEPLGPPGYDKHNNVRCAVLLDSGVFSRSCS